MEKPAARRVKIISEICSKIPQIKVKVSPARRMIRDVLVGTKHHITNDSPFDLVCQVKSLANVKFTFEKQYFIIKSRSTLLLKLKLMKLHREHRGTRVVLLFLPTVDEKLIPSSALFNLGLVPFPRTIHFLKDAKWAAAMVKLLEPLPIGIELAKVCVDTGVTNKIKETLTLAEFTLLDMALSDDIEEINFNEE